MLFENREMAGRLLAQALEDHQLVRPLLMAIPRGGVPVGAAMARTLGIPLDVVVTRKLSAPHNRELAVGAITPTGRLIVDDEQLARLGLDVEKLRPEIERQRHELKRRIRAYRGDDTYTSLDGRTLIVVDDGVATGLTLQAALEGLAHESPHRLITAIPVGPPQTLHSISRHCDELLYLQAPPTFAAVSQFYADFRQVTDAEVVRLLADFREPRSANPNGESHDHLPGGTH